MELTHSSLQYNIALSFPDSSPPVPVTPGISADPTLQPSAWWVALAYYTWVVGLKLLLF